jgi:putative ABC transport system substrate-binding protein
MAMNRRVAWLVTVLLLAYVHVVEAQQAKIPRIGFLRSGSAASTTSEREAFLQGLRDLGYVDGRNIMIEYRYAEGKAERWPVLAAELVKSNVDIFVVGGVGVTRAVHDATQTIPIVVGGAGDLVKSGLIASLAKPGGNITGSTEISTDLSGKRMELLKEVVPRASRVAVLWHSPTGLSDDDEELKQTKTEARQFGMNVSSFRHTGARSVPKCLHYSDSRQSERDNNSSQ